MKAILVLEDGGIFEGQAFGASGEAFGEVVFNTCMTGYQEILTDPSYYGQLVTMTYPHIGNYGVNPADVESERPHVSGFIVKEMSPYKSNWRATESLNDYLRRNNIVGIEGVDTRALTKHIREAGAKMGVISTVDFTAENLLQKVHQYPNILGRDLVQYVSCKERYEWKESLPENFYTAYSSIRPDYPKASFSVVVYDCGIKRNSLRWLVHMGCRVTVVPAKTTADEILQLSPHGILVSNGPGDPEGVTYVIANLRKLIGKKPIFGICLGHQLLGLALGAKTFKLKFGHHGGNHPVKELSTGKVEITSQNHGFALDPDSLPNRLEITHVNLNDGTVEGFRHLDYPIFAVQYHPEASPGPHDSGYLFKQFQACLKEQT